MRLEQGIHRLDRGRGARPLGATGECGDAAGAARDVDDAEPALVHGGVHERLGAGSAGHLEVHARRDARDAVCLGAPVAHDEALEAPLRAQDRREQLARVGRVLAVHEVVRGHDGSGGGLLHGALEAAQVQLAQGALVDDRVDDEPPVLLVVDGEVLEARPDARALDAARRGGGERARQQGVLARVLEVAAAQRVALEVEARPENDVDAEGARLAPHGGTELLEQSRVPARGGRDRGGEARAGRAAHEPEVVTALGLRANAVRPVAEHHLRDAPLGQRAGAPEICPAQQQDLLVEAQLAHVVIGVDLGGHGRSSGVLSRRSSADRWAGMSTPSSYSHWVCRPSIAASTSAAACSGATSVRTLPERCR